MKQTAVEWFFDKLKNHEIQAEHFELYKQAKEMEREQMEMEYKRGYDLCFDRFKSLGYKGLNK